MILSFSSILSQRLTAPIKATEILLIPLLLHEAGITINHKRITKNVLLATILIIAIFSTELYKNTNTSVIQGGYKEGTSVYNMKIYTIFNENEAREARVNRYIKLLRD